MLFLERVVKEAHVKAHVSPIRDKQINNRIMTAAIDSVLEDLKLF
jgi:hypothetical protein